MENDQLLTDDHLLTAQAHLLDLYVQGSLTDNEQHEQLVAAHRDLFQEGIQRGILSRYDILLQFQPTPQ